ncbi:MAG: Eco57I restriction-modification methylase domain-containing protein [Chloroflexi bacterium]|nr:Eco57I restriction-modification methylase domain-containing protein [Chloroflexota bacterium]MCY3938143.1 Eco57I restriction-modification methylase domain-containing protein [Chloroflexota bacterium]
MAFNAEGVRQAIRDFNFDRLFLQELGWDNPPLGFQLEVDDDFYSLDAVAEKAGMVAYVHRAARIPPRATRMKIERKLAKVAYEHLIVFRDHSQTRQVWQWAKRLPGRPPAYREHTFYGDQTGEALAQKLQPLAFDIEEDPSIVEVAGLAQKAFDVDRVTRRFYDRYKTEHTSFLNFVKGIPDQGDRDWYASLMLDRLMFVYFIQKKRFLDDDPDYLRNKLTVTRQQRGPDRFHSFYRYFLRRFFRDGLGRPPGERDAGLDKIIGKVPYLNGGIFDEHELERDYSHIEISDEAFEKLFDFFDAYQWHLDERPLRADNEINPDVLGYIFEKYVNQKQMGAYYTKEDITGYIAQNTIIPRLFDMARKECAIAFRPDSALWRLLSDDPDRYIYESMQKGVEESLPAEIEAGTKDVSKRGRWNEPAAEKYALPTETWREHVARRERHEDAWGKLVDGEVTRVDDLITLNLDIRQFAQDAILDCEGPDLLRAFYNAIRSISVLDPACGSGAFLFAALNVLEPLYEACLERMEAFVDELEHSGQKRSPAKFSDFRDRLAEVARHPNRRYFILKSIIIANLYGVDIMEEAVEICKLRLFLKLAAQAGTVDELEPLPDVDFNIRAGNTLVGFTSLDAVRQAMTVTPDGQGRQLFPEDQTVLDRIEEEAAVTSQAFDQFQRQQTVYGGDVTADDKADLRRRLENLGNELDRYLATEYGVDPVNPPTHNGTGSTSSVDCDKVPYEHDAYQCWRRSHQPFHWFVEFHGIMRDGGFDVVIGNPPYVARRKVVEKHAVIGFRTAGCSDIYAVFVERGINVSRTNGRISMIVPLSLTFSSAFSSLRALLYHECDLNWFSSFGRIPSALFSFDTRVRNTIYLGHKSRNSSMSCFTTRLHRWFDSQRETLFQNLCYSRYSPASFEGLIPKFGSETLLRAFESLLDGEKYRLRSEFSPRGEGQPLHFKQTAYNWLTFCLDLPPAYGLDGSSIPQSQYGTMNFRDEESRDISLLLANGKLMLAWWFGIGDDFHCTRKAIGTIPFGPGQLSASQRRDLNALVPELNQAMIDNLVFKLNARKNIGNYNLARCRHVTDEIDKIFLSSLGLRHLWEEIELEHALVVRTSFDNE